MVFSFQFCYAQTEIKEHNIVIQLNTADTSAWSSTIGNIKNIQKAWPNHLHIEVVVHGKAINLLVKDKTYFASDIADLTKEGIVFSACENTMRKYKIEKADLLIEAKTVPSGVVEVILKQEQGWRYLKAGIN
jgi:intracellular sulfur oxidation DsrE/DsrF family protein